ncbi:HtaA domain-containing protein [Corynebacterium suranareeae]|nr:HtaA domain-containing protein [Corynebacterium suranareeae]
MVSILLFSFNPTSLAQEADYFDVDDQRVELSEGSATWGIKQSWRNYIGVGLHGRGGSQLSAGAEWLDEPLSEIVWPANGGYFDPEDNSLELRLGGVAHFQSWFIEEDNSFLLDSKFQDLIIRISPDEQYIYGTYIGKDRDTFEDVILVEEPIAALDISNAEIETDGTTTTWSGITTFNTSNFPLYGEGVRFDDLSFSYMGPGGLPDVSSEFIESGTPLFSPSKVWDNGANNRAQVFPERGRDIVHVLERINPGASETTYKVTALDADDLSVLGTIEAPIRGGSFGITSEVAFDPTTGELYYQSVKAGESTTFEIIKISFDSSDSKYSYSKVYEYEAEGQEGVYLNWDEGRQNLVLLENYRVPKEGRASYSSKLEFIDIETSTAVQYDLFAALMEAMPVGSTDLDKSENWLTPRPGSVLNFNKFGFFRDGSMLLLTSGSYIDSNGQSQRMPYLRLLFESNELRVEPIEGVNPISPWPGIEYEYSSVGKAADGSLFLSASGWANVYSYIDIEDGQIVHTEPFSIEGVSTSTGPSFSDTVNSLDYVFEPSALAVRVFSNGKYFADIKSLDFSGDAAGVDRNGNVYTQVKGPGTSNMAIQKWSLDGVTPSIAEQPESHVIELGAGSSQEVTFTARAEGGTGQWAQQWQVKKPGESAFSDIDGATGESLTITASGADNGSVYRATFTGDIGTVASDEATLTVNYAPKVATQPASKDVVAGTPGVFQAAFTAHPEVEDVYWEYRSNGFWTRINTDNNFHVTTAEGLTSLTVTDTAVDQSGTRLRAVATNAAGTTMSREAVLTVRPATEIPDDGLSIDDVVLRWGISEEVQSRPPFGDSNYLSAGVSDGSALTYESTDGDVRIIHSDGTTDTEPDYASRAAHVSDATIDQLVEFGGGNAAINPDGSATVDWDGSFSINFYDGLVPFTITDPHLEVSAAGMGVLTGDLTGYEVEMSNPNEKTPLTDLYDDVTIATFSGVSIDPEGVVTITPDYDGVLADIPADVTPQVTTGAGWGAWPQGFLDFHFDTNLSSYWYSSGGAGDSKKAPMSFDVDFTNASDSGEQPGVPQASDLNAGNKGELVVPAEVEAGQEITIGGLPAGEDVDVVLFPTTFSFDRMTVGVDGTVTVIVPAGRGGENQVAVYEADKAGSAHVLGWSYLTIAGQDAQDPDPQDPQDPDLQDPGVPGSSVGSAFDTLIKIVSRIFGGLSALLGLWFGGLFSS